MTTLEKKIKKNSTVIKELFDSMEFGDLTITETRFKDTGFKDSFNNSWNKGVRHSVEDLNYTYDKENL